MTRFMVDSIDSSNYLPRSVLVPTLGTRPISLTAGYANGHFHISSQTDGETDVQIDVNGSAPGADVLDIEVGDATPSQVPAWVHAHNAHGGTHYPAILYVNRTNIHQVANALDNAGLKVERDYRWWIATLDGTETVADMTGVTAVQVYGAERFGERNIDLSFVYDDAWKANTPETSEVDMFIPLTVDMAHGRAFAACEVGGNSQWVSDAYVAGKSLWGAISKVRVVATDDLGKVSVLGTDVDFGLNVRHVFHLPSGTSDVTFEWDSSSVDSGIEFSGYVIGK